MIDDEKQWLEIENSIYQLRRIVAFSTLSNQPKQLEICRLLDEAQIIATTALVDCRKEKEDF